MTGLHGVGPQVSGHTVTGLHDDELMVGIQGVELVVVPEGVELVVGVRGGRTRNGRETLKDT
ncbi:hypothetical protein [Nonomuraea fuscirosea]|uniref:hypothetical protein n=1 Tax=Nonomuraea fuscirosea TaxID=1291556 RepID=UPI0011B20E63|nr:hypothetical protein [Nonomuraea fuscirosea]